MNTDINPADHHKAAVKTERLTLMVLFIGTVSMNAFENLSAFIAAGFDKVVDQGGGHSH